MKKEASCVNVSMIGVTKTSVVLGDCSTTDCSDQYTTAFPC